MSHFDPTRHFGCFHTHNSIDPIPYLSYPILSCLIMRSIYLVVAFLTMYCAVAFQSRMRSNQRMNKSSSRNMIEIEANSYTYGAMFLATMIPSIALVKFVGDQADTSRGSLSEKTKTKFVKQMLEQPGRNLQLPTSEEEALKKQVAKAYMQDKDVDVAILEEKLRLRAQWRKEMIEKQKADASIALTDEDGW